MGEGKKRRRPSQKSGLGMEIMSLQTLSGRIKWHSAKFNVSRGSRSSIKWETSV